jgi:hypothetical protein
MRASSCVLSTWRAHDEFRLNRTTDDGCFTISTPASGRRCLPSPRTTIRTGSIRCSSRASATSGVPLGHRVPELAARSPVGAREPGLPRAERTPRARLPARRGVRHAASGATRWSPTIPSRAGGYVRIAARGWRAER